MDGVYLPMRIIDHGVLTGYISVNRNWAGFDSEDYYRASQIAMGLLDEELEADLEKEYLPEGGHRIGGLVDHRVDDDTVASLFQEIVENPPELPTEDFFHDETEMAIIVGEGDIPDESGSDHDEG